MKTNTFVLAFLSSSLFLGCKSTDQAKTACIDPSKINKDRACTMQYDPVCGCDGKTYGNACMAENAGVTSYTKGECAAAKDSNP